MRQFLFFVFFFAVVQPAVAQDTTQKSKPFVLGVIEEIKSSVLSEKRTLNIYLPEGYNKNDTVTYPVIYLLDGSADEDFIHIAGLVQFANFPWVNLWPHCIVVGIANVDRRRDLTFPTTVTKDKKDNPTSGHSQKFIQFIETELQPFINSHYKTTSSKTIIGQSLGGLLATEILFTKPSLFNNYIIVSPSLWWNNESLLAQAPAVLKNDFTGAVSIFIAVGKEGKIMEGDSRKLNSLLKNVHKKNITVNFEYFPGDNHGSILHHAVYSAFEKMNPHAVKK